MSGSPPPARREQLERVKEHYRLQATQYADRCVSLTLLADAYGTDERSLLMDLAGSTRMGQIRAAGEVERARRLHDFYPRVLDLLRSGALLVPVVEMLLRKSKHCSDKVHDRLGQVLPVKLAGLDAADAYNVITRTILEVEGELEGQEQQERHAKAKANRGVWVFDVEDGMARVGAEVDSIRARQFSLDLDVLVRAEAVRDKRDGVARTAGQRRADVLTELPARVRMLLDAAGSGKLEALVHEARRRQEEGITAGSASQLEELPLDLPPRGRPPSWDVHVDELAIELFRQPLGPRAVLNVHQPMSSALGLDDSPARIDGGEYIPAWLGRLLIPDADLRRVAVSSATGVPLYFDHDVVTSHRRPPDSPPGPGRRRPPDPPQPAPAPFPHASPETDDEQVQLELHQNEQRLASAQASQQALLAMIAPLSLPDTTEPQYRPSAWLRAQVEGRDQRCTGPGCRRAARDCDLDHERQFSQGGATSEPNLNAKSRRCHLARHHGWTAVRDTRTSISTWTSPDGSVYVRLPAWVPHRSHEPVVALGLKANELPTTTSDYLEDRPLWRPPVKAAPRPTSSPLPAPRPQSSGQGWSDAPPPF
jgi:hypothetical protein